MLVYIPKNVKIVLFTKESVIILMVNILAFPIILK